MMIHLSDKCRYLYYNGIADMRKSFHGLAAIVTYQMQCDVLNGDIYIFISKRRNAIKLLRFEGDGFAVFYKRLEKGTFEIPVFNLDAASMQLTTEQLICMLQGIVLASVKYRRRYQHQSTLSA